MLRVFLINLDRSPERLAFMQSQADRIGLAFERFPAVDGRNLPQHLRPQFPASRLAPGEIGCYASHLLLYERIVREEWPYAMIVEDDVQLSPDLLASALAATDAAPPGWDYIHFSGATKRAVLSLASLPNGRHLVRHSRLPMNTGAYLISRQGAGKLLAPSPRVRPIDQEFRHAWLRDIDVLGVHPSPVIWNNAWPTTIAGTSRTEAIRKNKWSPGLVAEVQGWRYRTRKLGTKGYLACLHANFALALKRRVAHGGHNNQNDERLLVAPVAIP
jgi:glycosyl transferase, family 25